MKPCSECPFVRETPLAGSPEWLEDIFSADKAGKLVRHTCHKTDPNADGFNPKAKKVRECSGHIQMMINSFDGTPGEGGVYNSLNEMIERYLRHWLGDREFERIKGHNNEQCLGGEIGRHTELKILGF